VIDVPETLTPEQAEAAAKLSEAMNGDVRANLLREAEATTR
jgi:hypothetical protein